MIDATTTTQEIEDRDEAARASSSTIVGERRRECLHVYRGVKLLGFVRPLRTGQFGAIGVDAEDLDTFTSETSAAVAIISAASA